MAITSTAARASTARSSRRFTSGRPGDRGRARAVRAGACASVLAPDPGIADVAANVLDGLLVDQVAYDLRRLAAINSFFVENPTTGTMRLPRAYRIARGRAPYRSIAYALVAPRRRGEIGRLADTVFERRFGGLRGVRDLDYPVISRVLGGRVRSRGELSFWCKDATHDLSAIGPVDRNLVNEQEALDEFRALRRI